LLKLCSPDIRKNKAEQVLKSLEGNYKEEYLFGVRQALEMWEIYQQKIADCDKEIEKLLKKMTKNKNDPGKLSPPKQIPHHKPEIKDFHRLMMKLTDNKDATQISGINDYTLLQLVSETGLDLSKWSSEKHFTAWMGLPPAANSSGKQGRKRRKKKRKVNKAGEIFKQIAMNVVNGKHCALAGFYRRIKSRSGSLVANKATARKIAVYYYNLMTQGFDFVEEGLKKYDERYKAQMLKSLEKKAKEIGMKLVAA
jgi:transposase